ncbi:hypothetical protein HY224_03140, partial [Candidatus Uhrbacteria bacterium]|nr:hypothetical protein [Candidatus Uhrbacteria bacterium]
QGGQPKLIPEGQFYWVGRNSILHPIPRSKVRMVDRQEMSRTLRDAFVTNYRIGPSLDPSWVTEGTLFRTTQGGPIYIYEKGRARRVTAEGMRANRFQERFVRLRTDLNVPGVFPQGADLNDGSYLRDNPPSAPP